MAMQTLLCSKNAAATLQIVKLHSLPPSLVHCCSIYIPSVLPRILKVVLMPGKRPYLQHMLSAATQVLGVLSRACRLLPSSGWFWSGYSGPARLSWSASCLNRYKTLVNPTSRGALLPVCKLCGSICTLAGVALCSKIDCPERLLSSTCSNLKVEYKMSAEIWLHQSVPSYHFQLVIHRLPWKPV